MKYKISIIFLILSCLLNKNLISQENIDIWNGWRGMEKEGVLEKSNTPVEWNENKNIKWKAFIPGSGHSSPIVTNNSVIVTTAYQKNVNKTLNKTIEFITYGILLFLITIYLTFIWKSVRQRNTDQMLRTVNLSLFSFVFGLIVYFSLSGYIFPINNNSDHITQTFRWIFSSMVVCLCILLATLSQRINNVTRVFFLLITVLFLFLLIYNRPSPIYYTLTGDGYWVESLQKAILIPIVILLVLIVSFILKKRNTIHINFKFIEKHPYLITTFHVLIVLLSFTLGFYGIGFYRMVRYPESQEFFNFPLLDLYFRDSNLFKDIVMVSLVGWSCLFLIKNTKDLFYNSKGFVAGILTLSILIFVQKNYISSENEFVRSVICFDRNTGKQLWEIEVFPGSQPNLHPDNSPATPTPLFIENRIYAYFGTPGLVCTDLKGNILWEKTDIPFEDIHGIGASPVYCDGIIIILNDRPDSPYITAIESNTGKTIWTTKRIPWEGFHGAHRTPLVKNIDGKNIIITWGIQGLIAYDLYTGKEIWNYPVSVRNQQLVASIISNNDTFYLPDPDKTYCIDINSLKNKEPFRWETDMKHKGPICSSPVFYNNLLFTISDNGVCFCINAQNGNIHWMEKLDGLYMSSVTIINGKIYVSNTSGVTTVIDAKEAFHKVCENILPEPIYASFAPASEQLFIRTTSHLYCICNK